MTPEIPGSDQLSVFFLSEGEQSGGATMKRLADFFTGAKETLDLALYDMRFSDELKRQFLAALQERAQHGVRIRICYDGDKPSFPNMAQGQDPSPPGTASFVESLGFPSRRIGGMKLMHHKFIVRDRSSVWTGSTNMTDDAFSLMENNIVVLDSPGLAAWYAEDFEELWQKENFEETGDIKTEPVSLRFAGANASVQVMFSPGRGLDIDTEVGKPRSPRSTPGEDLQLAAQLRHAHRRTGRSPKRRARRGERDLRSHPDAGRDSPVARRTAKPLEDSGAAKHCRARRPRRKKFDTLQPDRAARLHAQQNPGDRRHGHHRFV